MTGTAAGLRAVLRGPVIGPSSEGYDMARRVWNGAIDRRPASGSWRPTGRQHLPGCSR